MDRVTKVLATTNEISLKGGNRPWFERTLTDNVRTALDDLPVEAVHRPSWRVLVTFKREVDFDDAAKRLSTVFGINAIMSVRLAGHTFEDLIEALEPALESLEADSFAVRCTRSDKRFSLTSPEVERQVGTFVQQLKGWPVNLRRPHLKISVLVDDRGVFFWTRRIRGPGGLPVGVSGRAVCLLSGGIDSPVAAWLMLKRGMRLDFVHFHSIPRTNPASVHKVRRMVQVLNRYQPGASLALVPLLEIQEEIVARCPPELRVLLYRRFMVRLANACAGRHRSSSLVTGEALGQVASQTIENLAAVESVADFPVMRPLIGFDKQEIITLARRIGTYDISVEPHQDCCSFLMPSNPATRSHAGELASAESELDVDALVDRALAATEFVSVDERAAWEDVVLCDDTRG